MRVKNSEIFSELDFITLLLQEFRKNGIYKFSEKELEKDLYYYQQMEKYRPLFYDIDARNRVVHIREAVNMLSIFGAISTVGLNRDMKYISISNDDSSDYNQENGEKALLVSG